MVASVGADSPALVHRSLGRMCYDEALEIQRSHRRELLEGRGEDVVLTVEHAPGVLTAGRRALPGDLRLSSSELDDLGVDLRDVERGGSWTWHGPGQLVAYPVIALRRWNLKVPAFVSGLEWAMALLVQRLMSRCGVEVEAVGLRVGVLGGFPGTWVRRGDGSRAKLGAVGVHLRRFVSLHGLALNLDPRPWGFDRILPCGLQDEVSSVARLLEELGGEPAAVPSVEEAAGWLAVLLPRAWEEPLSLRCESIE